MLAITLSLLHGTFHGGSADDTVPAGGQVAAEWPPSPARLFSALVAAEGTRDRCQFTTGEELSWLERLPPPDIYASPPEDVLVSRLQDRYVVVDATEDGAVQDYPARQARLVRRGVRQSPRDARITYAWPDASPSLTSWRPCGSAPRGSATSAALTPRRCWPCPIACLTTWAGTGGQSGPRR